MVIWFNLIPPFHSDSFVILSVGRHNIIPNDDWYNVKRKSSVIVGDKTQHVKPSMSHDSLIFLPFRFC